jgi:hypothetical protein
MTVTSFQLQLRLQNLTVLLGQVIVECASRNPETGGRVKRSGKLSLINPVASDQNETLSKLVLGKQRRNN